MLDHVVKCLRESDFIDRVLLLSPHRVGAISVVHDEGRGLNEELCHARNRIGLGPLLVLPADLPLLQTEDINALLQAAVLHGQAIAPDRDVTGTNAIAIADGTPMQWRFGANSFAEHRTTLPANHAVVERPGLQLDCDTPDGLSCAERAGFAWRRLPASY